MKKLLLGVLMSFILISNSFGVNVPSSYNVVASNSGITTYSNSENFYVIDAPTGKFGLDLSSVGDNTDVNKWGVDIYERLSMRSHWLNSGQPYATLNGQFFGYYTSTNGISSGALSMQLKGNDIVFQNNNLEKSFSQKSLYMYKGVLPLFVQGYSTSLLNDYRITDAISSFNADSYSVVANKIKATEKIGRHYIGCIVLKKYSTALSTCNNLLFFYSRKATHQEMMNEITSWGVKSNYIMVMDGSGSAQLYSDNLILYGYNGSRYENRPIPSGLSIYAR